MASIRYSDFKMGYSIGSVYPKDDVCLRGVEMSVQGGFEMAVQGVWK